MLESDAGSLPLQIVLVDYDSLPMRCKACLSWMHRVKDCDMQARKKPTCFANKSQQQHYKTCMEKGKDICTDQEGFQIVSHRSIGTRRDISGQSREIWKEKGLEPQNVRSKVEDMHKTNGEYKVNIYSLQSEYKSSKWYTMRNRCRCKRWRACSRFVGRE